VRELPPHAPSATDYIHWTFCAEAPVYGNVATVVMTLLLRTARRRERRALVWVFGIFLGAPVACLAQAFAPTQRQAREFSDFVCAHIQEIGQSGRNLNQMTGNFSKTEDERTVAQASNDSMLAYTWGLWSCDISRLYSVMTSASDREYARGVLILQSQALVREFELQIKWINSELPALRSPAAVSEVGKLRDLLQIIRDRANEFAPPTPK
jgi:hypothetical protein